MTEGLQSNSTREYLERLSERATGNISREALCCKIWQITKTAERHWHRLLLSQKRLARATSINNAAALAYEKEVILISAYEILDTVYIALQLLDLDRLHLQSSSDGLGLTGEDANYVFELLQNLDNLCLKTLEAAAENGIKIDFLRPVDELEGITFTESGHWYDFVPGSIERSFSLYFTQARRSLNHRLNQVPHFWRSNTLTDVIIRGRYVSLRKAVYCLQRAIFPQVTLSSLIEKEIVQVRSKLNWQSIPLFKPSSRKLPKPDAEATPSSRRQ